MATRRTPLLAWMRLVRITQIIQQRESALLATHRLTVPQFDVLLHLSLHEGISQQELATALLVTKGNICGILDRLALRGLVERRDDPQDKRSHHLVLTTAGRSLITSVQPVHDTLIVEALGQLTSLEQQRLADLAQRLLHRLRP